MHDIEISVYLLKGHAFGDRRNKGPRKNRSADGIPFTYLGFRQRPEKIVFKLADQTLSLIRLILLLFSLVPKRKSVTILLYNSEIVFNLPIFFIKKLAGIRLVKFSAEIIDRSQYSNSLTGRLSRASHKAGSRYLATIPDKLIVFSHYLKDSFVSKGFLEKNIVVQPNLTDFSYWQVAESEVKYTIGYSGAPYMKDGLNDLLTAVSLLLGKGRDVSLLIIGDATFGRTLIPGLKMECDRLGIGDKVTFTGLVSSKEVKEYLSQCQILAVTRPDTVQTRSGFPTKLGEYFAMKKPILATKFGDMQKYFTDGIDIIMAECSNPLSIMERIEWILDNPSQIGIITRKGYDTARELLEYQDGMKRILKFLSS